MSSDLHANASAGVPPWQERWAAGRFFWARIDAASIQADSRFLTRASRERRLGFAFEATLPGITLDQLHAAYARCSDDPKSVIACGALKETLSDLDRRVLSIVPAELPPFLEGQAPVSKLELLTGQMTPRPVRRLKWCCTRLLIIALSMFLIFVGVGLERRARDGRAHAARIRLHTENRIAAALPPSANSKLPASLRVLTELRTLEQTRGPSNAVAISNAVADLASLLERWPGQLHILTESMTIAPDSMNLQGRAPSMADVQALATVLERIDGFRMQQPQSSIRGGSVEFTLRLLQDGKESAP